MKIQFKSLNIMGHSISVPVLAAAALVAITLVGVVTYAAVSFFTRDSGVKTPDAIWAEHIKAHTSGDISKNSSIKVVFINDIVSEQEVGAEASKIFSFSPGIRGKAVWTAKNELEFTYKHPQVYF